MPITTLTKPAYPSVPQLPGVPSLPRALNQNAAIVGITARVSSVLAIASALTKPIWGVYNSSHMRVLEPDSIVEVKYAPDTKVMAFPVQEGAFASYNKVNMPNEVSVRMTLAGSVALRTAFINSVEQMIRSLNLYSVITPERTFIRLNPVSYTWDRKTPKESRFLDITLHFIEIRTVQANVTSTGALSALTADKVQDPSSSSSVNTGNASPAPVPSVLSKSIP